MVYIKVFAWQRQQQQQWSSNHNSLTLFKTEELKTVCFPDKLGKNPYFKTQF